MKSRINILLFFCIIPTYAGLLEKTLNFFGGVSLADSNGCLTLQRKDWLIIALLTSLCWSINKMRKYKKQVDEKKNSSNNEKEAEIAAVESDKEKEAEIAAVESDKEKEAEIAAVESDKEKEAEIIDEKKDLDDFINKLNEYIAILCNRSSSENNKNCTKEILEKSFTLKKTYPPLFYLEAGYIWAPDKYDLARITLRKDINTGELSWYDGIQNKWEDAWLEELNDLMNNQKKRENLFDEMSDYFSGIKDKNDPCIAIIFDFAKKKYAAFKEKFKTIDITLPEFNDEFIDPIMLRDSFFLTITCKNKIHSALIKSIYFYYRYNKNISPLVFVRALDDSFSIFKAFHENSQKNKYLRCFKDPK